MSNGARKHSRSDRASFSFPYHVEIKSSRLDFINWIRGLAAVAVFVFHLQLMFLNYPQQDITKDMAEWWWCIGLVDLGKIAVVSFFFVSGYLIPNTLRKRESVGDFAIRRFFRLYPAFWFSILFRVFILFALGNAESIDWSMVFVNTTMLHRFFGKQDFIQKELPVALFLGISCMFFGDLLRAYEEGQKSKKILLVNLILFLFGVIPISFFAYNSTWTRYVFSYWAALLFFAMFWKFRAFLKKTGKLNQIMNQLGEVSYGIYLISSSIIMSIANYMFNLGMNKYIIAVSALSVILVISLVCLVFIERPCIEYGGRLADNLIPKKMPNTR